MEDQEKSISKACTSGAESKRVSSWSMTKLEMKTLDAAENSTEDLPKGTDSSRQNHKNGNFVGKQSEEKNCRASSDEAIDRQQSPKKLTRVEYCKHAEE
jgi:hypothetical protein